MTAGRSIGISNFEGKFLEELETKWEVIPQFIQVEAHPYFTQKELRKTPGKYDIRLMSWYSFLTTVEIYSRFII